MDSINEMLEHELGGRVVSWRVEAEQDFRGHSCRLHVTIHASNTKEALRIATHLADSGSHWVVRGSEITVPNFLGDPNYISLSQVIEVTRGNLTAQLMMLMAVELSQ